MFWTFPARRISQNSRKTNRIVGTTPTSRLCHQGGPRSSGSAFTTTPLRSSNVASASVSANAGISVLNRVGFLSSNGTGSVNAPWIAVPLEVISFT